MKATILLAIALFLAAAPEPDSDAISEMTAQFIVLEQPARLQAAEKPLGETADKPETPVKPGAQSTAIHGNNGPQPR